MTTKLQKLREIEGLTVVQLAQKAQVDKVGDIGHFVETIKTIETGVPYSPRPRKNYEWLALAEALDCDVMDIFEEVEEL